MLQTSYGFVPWDDAHHPELSQTDGVPDGRWLFINGNNTPRIARIDLTRFETDEILEIPNAAGGHASPFTTPNNEYIVSAHAVQRAGRRNTDVPIDELQGELQRARCRSSRPTSAPARWTSRSRSCMPGYNYDLGHAGKGPSRRLVLLHVVQHRAGEHQARGERVAERQGLHRRGELQAGRGSASREGKAKTDAGAATRTTTMDPKSRIAHGRRRRPASKMLDPDRLPGTRLLPADAQVAARRGRRSDRRVHRRRRQARDGHPGALVHEAAEGDRRQGVRDDDRRHPGAQVRGRRSPAKCRSPASARCTPSSTARATPTPRCSSRPRS